MKTDELVTLLATRAQPVVPHAAQRRLAAGLALAVPLSLAAMALALGLRPGLAADLGDPMAWVKILAPVAVAAAGFFAVERLGRPGVRAGRAWWIAGAAVLVLWGLGAWSWVAAPAPARPGLVWGLTWRECAANITLLSTPVFVAAFWVLRGLAPTRPAAAGFGAGLLAGGTGAAVYALHCPELAGPFLAIWFVLGMAIPPLAGAALGPRLLRW